MFIVLGATGHVGSAVAEELLRVGESVTAVVRNDRKAERLRANGAVIATVDVRDVEGLRGILRTGRRAFLLNPPASVSGDTDIAERQTALAIVEALEGSGLEKVVAQSTYGAQPGRGIGDLGVLHDFEEALRTQPIPTTVLRAAYYMSNWDPMLEVARGGTLPSMFPSGFVIPMVAPDDLGSAAVRLLREPSEQNGIHHIEGPSRYSPQDVAQAFAEALGRPVEVAVTPRDAWVDAFLELGFSKEAATSYAGMTAVSLEDGVQMPDQPDRGTTSLRDYISRLAARAPNLAT